VIGKSVVVQTTRVSGKPSAGVVYDRWVFNRSLLVWAHVVLAIVAGLLYLDSTNVVNHIAYWRRGAAGSYVLLAATAMLPYLFSAIYSWNRVSHRRLGLWIFILILVVGTVAVGYWYVGGPRDTHGSMATVYLILAQCVVYLWSASLCLATV
jgi:hypothetical protein